MRLFRVFRQHFLDSRVAAQASVRRSLGYQNGFTLVELVLVIAILALILVSAGSRFGEITGWRYNSELRRFVNTWQFLFSEAIARREAYRLIINLDDQSYIVMREVPLERNQISDIDRVSKFRSREEQERREQRKREREQRMNLGSEFEEEDARQSNTLEDLFYQFALSDAEGAVRLTVPLEFPSLGEEPIPLSRGLYIRDVVVGNTKITSGEVQLRLAPTGATDFAVVHFDAQGELFTATVNPATGEPTLLSGDSSFDWGIEKSELSGSRFP